MTTQRVTSDEQLNPLFRHGVIWLEHLLDVYSLPLVRFETYRSNERQNMLYKRGNTKARAGHSAHNHGFAVDYVLDTSKVETAQRLWKGRMVKFAWDTDSSEEVRRIWLAFGRVVERVGMEWGGRYGVSDKKTIGWDFPHVQHPDWRNLKNG